MERLDPKSLTSGRTIQNGLRSTRSTFRSFSVPILRQLVKRRALARRNDRELARAQRHADFRKREFDGGAGITFAREVREIDSAPAWAGDGGEQFPRGQIREVAMPA